MEVLLPFVSESWYRPFMFGSRVGVEGNGGSGGLGGGGECGCGCGLGPGGGGLAPLHQDALARQPVTSPVEALPSAIEVSVVQ